MRAGDVSTDAFVAKHLARQALSSSRFGLVAIGHLAGALLIVWLFRDAQSLTHLGAWVGALAAVLALQSVYAGRTLASAPAAIDEAARYLIAFQLVLAALWVYVSLGPLAGGTPDTQLFVLFVVGGIAVATVGSHHAQLAACIAFLSTAFLPLAVSSFLDGYRMQPVLLLLFYAVLLRLAVLLRRFANKTLTLRYERDLLLESLADAAVEVEEANAAKSRFLAQASHDLRQPMHAVGLFMETLADYPVDDKVGDVVTKVRKSVEVLSRLFDSLLDTSLLDSGQVKVSTSTFPLDEVFRQLAREFNPVAQAGDVELRFRPSNVRVACDPVLLRRMIQNLIANAIRHARGKVLVGVRRRSRSDASAPSISVGIHDDGRGIPEEHVDAIFREFVRLDGDEVGQRETERIKGLGLGLSIVDRLAGLLGLTVSVSSSPGRGSVFFIDGIERVSAMADATMPATLEPGRDSRFAGSRILIVDDDVETLNASNALLSKWGCEVSMHTGRPEACKCPDVLICDYDLGAELDGFDVIDDIRVRFGPEVPAIVITGSTSNDVIGRAERAGIPVLTKPVRPAQLRSALLSALTVENEEPTTRREQ